MFLIPLVKPFDWRRPPVVTMLIILANVIVFVIWQAPTKPPATPSLTTSSRAWRKSSCHGMRDI